MNPLPEPAIRCSLFTAMLTQPEIGIVVEYEPASPSRVWNLVHDEDARMCPFPSGIVSVKVAEAPLKVCMPVAVNGVPPPAGRKMTRHRGVFSPPLPAPDEGKLVQLNVTEPQVAVAVASCA